MGQSNTLAGGKRSVEAKHSSRITLTAKRHFCRKLATLAGKSSPEQLTARERLDAMAKYRTLKKQQVKNALDGVQLSEERRRKFAEISNRVAKRIGHRASLGQENRNQWSTSMRDSITKKL
jgi:ABC-type multidrug transport system ATPase subunit